MMTIGIFNGVTSAILAAGVGVYPYLCLRNNVTRLFAISNLLLAVWNLNDLVMLLPASHAARLILYRVGYLPGVFLVWYFFNFMLTFARVNISKYQQARFVLKVSGVIIGVLMLTPLIVKEANETRYPFDVPGPLYPLFAAYFLGGIGFAFYQLFKAFRVSRGLDRIQLKYMFVALFFGVFEALLFFVDIYTFKIATYFYYSQVVYSLIVAYAILAHRLMDINVIIRKTAIYSVVTGALTAVYLLTTTLLAHLLTGVTGSAGFWSSAAAAVTITLLFNPVLNRVRAFMDEKLFGNWLQDMSRGIVHEVKRPLASISMPAQLTLMELEEIEKGRQSFESLLPEFKERMRGIVRKSMEAAERIEALYAMSGSNGNTAQAVDMAGVIQSGVTALKGIQMLSSSNLVIDVPSRLHPVLGYPKQLEIVLLNLLKNAVEAMAGTSGGRIRLKAFEEGKWLILSVQDNGPGIKPEDLEQVFNPNFTTKGSQGMGLGLYLCNKIIREHNGSLEVQSELGKGTEFVIRLPQYTDETGAAA